MSPNTRKRYQSFAFTTNSITGEKNEFVLGVDEMLPYVGDFGRYQKLMIFLVSLLYTPIAFHPFLMYFATLVPSWECVANSTICSFNGSFTGEDTRRCDIPRSEWTYTEGKLFSIVTQFDLSCNELWIVSLITFVYFTGWGIGAVLIGQISDRYGRKISLLPGLIATLVTGIANPFLPNVYLIVLSSFIQGFCYTAVETQSSILLTELVGTQWRPIASRVSSLMFPVIWILLSLKAYLLKNWRDLSLICTLPYIFTVAIYFFIPESIHWLQTNGRPEEGRTILVKIGLFNNQELSEKIVVSKTQTETKETGSSLKNSIFGSRELVKQSLALMCIWCFTLMSYYGLVIGSSELGDNLYKDFALVCVTEFPGILLAVVVCKVVGRKAATLVNLALGGVACLIIPLISKQGGGVIARLILGILGRLAIGINCHSMIVWTTELYPTEARSTALGVMHAVARVGAASSPWIVKGLKEYGDWIPFTVMGATALIGSLAGVKLRETKDEQIVEAKEVSRRVNRIGTIMGVEVPNRKASKKGGENGSRSAMSGFSNPIYELDGSLEAFSDND